jgi:hypothetical protein
MVSKVGPVSNSYLPAAGSKFAEFDREVLTLIHTAAGPADRTSFSALFHPLTEPRALAQTQAIYARLDELADADPGDPRVADLAGDLAAHLPDEMASALVASVDDAETGHWLKMLSQELSAAQYEAFRLLMIMLKERR